MASLEYRTEQLYLSYSLEKLRRFILIPFSFISTGLGRSGNIVEYSCAEEMSIVDETNILMEVVDEMNSHIEVVEEKVVDDKKDGLKTHRRRSRKQIQKNLSYLQKLNIKYKKECKEFRNLKKFNLKVKKFFECQLSNIKIKEGETYKLHDKEFALAIFKQSRKCYNFLSSVSNLPSLSTLLRFSNEIRIDPGLNDNIFNTLKQHLGENSVIEDRLVTLIFDEMSITPHLDYLLARGVVSGFEDDGYERTSRIADHAQVFMMRSIYRKWKFPVSFSFTQGTTKSSTIVQLIKDIVTRLTNIGYIVVALVCGQGPTTCTAINMLLENSKRIYIKENKEPKANIIRIGNCEIVPLYDICDIIKCMRNNLLNKNLKFTLNRKHLTASWEDVLTAYFIDTWQDSWRTMPKLSERHVYPEKIPKMKVSKAVQVFSYTVSTQMKMLIDMNYSCPNGRKFTSESMGTAFLCNYLNKLFDSLNVGIVNDNKDIKKCVAMGSKHLQLWYEAKEVVKSMKFVKEKNELNKQPSVLRNFVATIDGFINLHNILLQNMDLKYLPTKSFNQDPLKNYFGLERQKGVLNNKPSCALFISRFTTLVVNNVIISNARGTNCQPDFCGSIVGDLNIFLNQAREGSKMTKQLPIKYINDDPLEEIIFSNMSVNILKQIEQFIVKNNCDVCNKNIYAGEGLSFRLMEQKNSYNEQYFKTYCSEILLRSLIALFNTTYFILPYVLTEKYDPYITLKDYVKDNTIWNFEKCAHTDDFIDKLVENVLRNLFRRYFNTLNGILKHDSEIIDNKDPLQRKFLKYVRNKGIKKHLHKYYHQQY